MSFSENDIETTIIPSPQTRYAGANVGVRVKHIPSNIATESTSAPSQYLNKRIALAMLQYQLKGSEPQ
ncbi:hypothetical protein [Celerinatantimonas sp. MCCC 1A17872]|uniref:hypothetical protein n=1 Tax=Celerinatantimonas sp. MCCC 1A17872 TaxID=3177514 RepID=UPI0038C52DE4